MNHLEKITLANIPAGCINPTDEQIIAAMQKAVAKEADINKQLFKSRPIIGGSFDRFSMVVSGMLYAELKGDKK